LKNFSRQDLLDAVDNLMAPANIVCPWWTLLAYSDSSRSQWCWYAMRLKTEARGTFWPSLSLVVSARLMVFYRVHGPSAL